MSLLRVSDENRVALGINWGWFFLWGLALIVLGTIAITYANVTTVVSIMTLGIILAICGVVGILDAFQFWWRMWGSFFLHLIIALLYLAAGVMLIKGPLAGSVSLTLLMAILFITVGIIRIIYSLIYQLPGRGWRFFNGLTTLVLGILILKSWPESGLFIIGLFVGIDLIFAGWVYIMGAFAARSLTKEAK
jgi:uncharacterized membrane protein HdeD (DUF308 family)